MLSTTSGERLLQRWFPFRLPAPAPAKEEFRATCTIEDPGFDKNETITILSFHWGVTQSRKAWEPNESGLQTQDFSVVKRVDAASPSLFTAAAQGTKLNKVVVVLFKGSKPFATYEFETVYVSSVRPGGGGGADFPLEEVSFNFASSTYKYEK